MVSRLTGVTGGEVVVAALAAEDVEVVFGIPGTHNLSVFAALGRHGIASIATTHEQGAGYAADGYARTCRRPGVAVVTSGPAVFNAATAVAQSYSDSIPVLLVSPGMSRSHPVTEPGSGFLHEAKDQQGAMDRIVASSLRPISHQEIADAVAATFSSFRTARPRPVHLEIPLDLIDELGDADVASAPGAPWPEIDEQSLQRAASALATSTSPIIIAGGGAIPAAQAVTDLAVALDAPVLTTVNGKGVLDESHRLSWGARIHLPEAMTAVAGCDVLLVVGSELGQSDVWAGPVPQPGAVIRIDVDPTMADVNLTSDVMLTGHAERLVPALTEAVTERLAANLREPGEPDRVGRTRDVLQAAAELEGRRWLPWLRALDEAVSDDVVYATDNAMCVYYGAVGNLQSSRAGSFHFPAGFGTLGFTVPVAIGAALAAPERQVVGITGDGGFLFTATELAVAAAQRLNIAIVIFDNEGYGEILRRDGRAR